MVDDAAPSPTVDDDRRALAHIRGRTTSGKSAARLFDWDEPRWQAMLARLAAAGHISTHDPPTGGGHQ